MFSEKYTMIKPCKMVLFSFPGPPRKIVLWGRKIDAGPP